MRSAQNIYLKPYSTDDFDHYYKLVKEERVMYYITGRSETFAEATANYNQIIAYNHMHNDRTGYYQLYVETSYVGFGKLSWDDNHRLEIGYMILPAFWRQGYAKQCIQLLLELAQNSSIKTNEIIANIDPENKVSKHLLTTFGFISVWKGIEAGLPSEHLSLKIPNFLKDTAQLN